MFDLLIELHDGSELVTERSAITWIRTNLAGRTRVRFIDGSEIETTEKVGERLLDKLITRDKLHIVTERH